MSVGHVAYLAFVYSPDPEDWKPVPWKPAPPRGAERRFVSPVVDPPPRPSRTKPAPKRPGFDEFRKGIWRRTPTPYREFHGSSKLPASVRSRTRADDARDEIRAMWREEESRRRAARGWRDTPA